MSPVAITLCLEVKDSALGLFPLGECLSSNNKLRGNFLLWSITHFILTSNCIDRLGRDTSLLVKIRDRDGDKCRAAHLEVLDN